MIVMVFMKNMSGQHKICGTCQHIRLSLGIVTSLDFKSRLEQVLERLSLCDADSICVDSDLLSILSLINELSRQKFYCLNEQGWTHLFDRACYAWQQKETTRSQ